MAALAPLPSLPVRPGTAFLRACDALGVDPNAVEEVAPYVLTDGTRTSTSLTGTAAYLDGAAFVMRLAGLHQSLGGRVMYALTTGRKHRVRENYGEIFTAIRKALPSVRATALERGMKVTFYGDFLTSPSPEAQAFAAEARHLSEETGRASDYHLILLVDYAADYAVSDESWRELPQANVIIKHTKGQINEGLWLPDKLRENSFLYAQNGSMSSTWSDEDLACLLATACRSYANHHGLQYGRSYTKASERDAIRREREENLSFVHRALRPAWTKRVLVFSGVGPEVYEF